MPPDDSWPTPHGLIQKAWNRKNVLKNILHLPDFATWAFLCTKQQKDNICLN